MAALADSSRRSIFGSWHLYAEVVAAGGTSRERCKEQRRSEGGAREEYGKSKGGAREE